MDNFTFLTEEQIFGDDQLDIIKKYGTECKQTDFSHLLGGVEANCWWTKTPYNHHEDSGYNYDDVRVVRHPYRHGWDYVSFRITGARPAIPYSSISSISSNGVRDRHGILEVEYGEYPQTVVSEDFARTLERAYSNRSINQTGKSYTTDSDIRDSHDVPFQARTHIEYEYNGRKYIRFVGDSMGSRKLLSDGRLIQIGQVYWVEVEPIKWLIDERTNIALSKKIIFAGIQFNRENNYKGDFNRTDIKEFMDRHFSKDITPSFVEAKERRNPYGFNLSRVGEEDIIRGAIESGVALFLHGESSIGKSARVKQIDPDCVIIYLRNATPESLNGKSAYNSETREMIDVKPTWLKRLEDRCEKEPDKYHIVFLDEITNAPPNIQDIVSNIVLNREVNGIWQLPKNARIVAAGNNITAFIAANSSAQELFNSFIHVSIKTTIESCESGLKWASEHNIHPAIYSYIAYTKGEILRSEHDRRRWEIASKILYATGSPDMLRTLVGESITAEFVHFCNQQVITLDDVINGKYTDRDIQLLTTEERYATTLGLFQVEEEHLDKVRGFVTGLGAEFGAIFDALWIHGDASRLERIEEAKLANMPGKGIRR